VCLGPDISVIDCLEFSRDLRLLDPLDDIALLALEMERLGQPQLAELLLQRFNAALSRPAGAGLLHFYLSLRAATRAKVAAWHLEDPQFKVAQPWIDRTHSLLQDGLRHAQLALALREST
jgi:aminoglycoside phosphotransferase family enzyme